MEEMTSAKAWFGAAVGRFLFREVEVTSLRDVGARLRLVDVRGEELRGVSFTPGDKVQVFLPGEGMRTYTPLRWDAARGETSFLLHVHGAAATPGARWAAGLACGDRFRFFGPRASLAPAEGTRVVVGDETSFAVAAALNAVGVFEAADVEEARRVLAALGVREAVVVSRGDIDALVASIVSAMEAHPAATLSFTGCAQTIQSVRAALRARGPLPPGRSKAYWSAGKAGLD